MTIIVTDKPYTIVDLKLAVIEFTIYVIFVFFHPNNYDSPNAI